MKTWWTVAAALGVTTAAVGSWPPIPPGHAAEGGSGGSATCTVTVHVTDEDGTVDTDVRTRTAPCQPGQFDGGHVWYNPYTGTSTYTNYVSEGPIGVPVYRPRKKASGSSGTTGSASNRSSGSSASSGQSGSTTSATGPKGNRTPKAPPQ